MSSKGKGGGFNDVVGFGGFNDVVGVGCFNDDIPVVGDVVVVVGFTTAAAAICPCISLRMSLSSAAEGLAVRDGETEGDKAAAGNGEDGVENAHILHSNRSSTPSTHSQWKSNPQL